MARKNSILSLKSCLTAAVLSAVGIGAGQAATIHMALNGNDVAPGTPQAPVATMGQAITLAEQSGEPSEIVLQEGRYPGRCQIQPSPASAGKGSPRLIIRAADGAKVIFDGGTLLRDAKPLGGVPDVYCVKGSFAGNNVPSLWEEDTRVRYRFAADTAAVKQSPGTMAFLDDNTLIFSTSDRRPLEQHVVRAHFTTDALDNMAFIIWRENVTFHGIAFENWTFGAVAVDIRAKGFVMEDCTMFNCWRCLYVAPSAVGSQIRRCTGTDVGAGIYINGTNTTVEYCRFTRAEDRFAFEMNGQDNSGIQYYAPAKSGVVRFNQCHGFNYGIFIKGAPGDYRIEHNTVTGSGGTGIYNQQWLPGNVCRQNIFDGGGYAPPEVSSTGFSVDANILWTPDNRNGTLQTMAELVKAGFARTNRFVDPLFADPDRGDYRLLSASPALQAGDSEGPVGALPQVPSGYSNACPPSLRVTLDKPARFNGSDGSQYLIDDPSNGGRPRFRHSIRQQPRDVAFITKDLKARVLLYGSHPTSPLAQMKVFLNGQESAALPYQPAYELPLPPQDGIYRIVAQVSNKEGVWSTPTTVEVILSRQAPSLAEAPALRTGAHGAVIALRTDRPGMCAVEVDAGGGQWKEFPAMPASLCRWKDEDLARDETYSVVAPKATAEIADTASVACMYGEWIKPGTNYAYRIKIRDHAGNHAVTNAGVFEATGGFSTLYLSPQGQDVGDRGSREKPFATLQYALDRALPGDTVRLMPGMYIGAKLFHGGLPGAPITIEAETPGSVVLDGRKEVRVVLGLDNASWTVIRGLEVRWFQQSGIQVMNSENVVITGCRVWNDAWHMWPEGVGIRFTFSPKSTLDHCTLYRCGSGMYYYESREARITYNTIVANLLGGFGMAHSSKNTVIRNNAICFTGNVCISLLDQTEADIPTIDMDYNNYACTIREAAGDVRPKNNIVPTRYPYLGESKRIIEMQKYGTAFTLEKWRELSGKDTHSIYADPLWIDPRAGRFDVETNSPNIGAGENGTTIGAAGYVSGAPGANAVGQAASARARTKE